VDPQDETFDPPLLDMSHLIGMLPEDAAAATDGGIQDVRVLEL
jgi:hypothetical protein